MARRTTTNSFAAAAAFLAVALAAVASLSPTPALAGPDFNAEAAQPVARPITLAEKYALLYEQRLPPVGFQVGALNPSNAQLVRLLVDQPYPSSYSLSDAATRYVASIQKANGDGYNGTVALAMSIWSVCQVEGDTPVCEFLWSPGAKLSGLKTIATPPAGVKLVDCSLYFDGTVVSSPSCWDGANVFGPVGKTLVKSKYPAQQIQIMNFTVNAIDENPVPGSDVAAAGGKFRVLYTHGQFAENSQFSLFNRLNQAIVTDPRVTNWIPDVGEFGDSGVLRGKNMTTGKPVVEGYTKKPGQLIPLGTGSQTIG